jgi:hypothetical protein
MPRPPGSCGLSVTPDTSLLLLTLLFHSCHFSTFSSGPPQLGHGVHFLVVHGGEAASHFGKRRPFSPKTSREVKKESSRYTLSPTTFWFGGAGKLHFDFQPEPKPTKPSLFSIVGSENYISRPSLRLRDHNGTMSHQVTLHCTLQPKPSTASRVRPIGRLLSPPRIC